MLADLEAKEKLESVVTPVSFYLKRPIRLFRTYDRDNLRPDLVAAVTVAVILLPQAIAFTLIAELPPQMGLYTSIVAAVVAALWGSSNQAHTGPSNAISLVVLSALLGIATPGTAEFVLAAGLMAVMVGVFQLVLGLARLGVLVNFVSHSVIVGFASGAGILIAIKQVSPLLGIQIAGQNLFEEISGLATSLSSIHLYTAGLGVGTIILIILLRRFNSKLPAALLSMVVASIMVFVLGLDEAGVGVIGRLPAGLPPLADLPLFNLDFISRLSAGALAVGAIGLVQTIAIARSMAAQTGQRLDSNQEFVGQGLANIAAGLFSGYPCSGSFSRSAVNFRAEAKTPMASVFSGLFVLVAMLALTPLTAYLPRTALAGVLIVIAYDMVDRKEIARIWRGVKGDAVIMVVTLLGTLFLPIEFAVLVGILLSFAFYIMRTSAPRVRSVLPDSSYKHFGHYPDKDPCPQLVIIDISGDLYFGAVNHVEEAILARADAHPEQRYLLIRMNRVNHCDFSGIHMLENVVRAYRERGGDVFLVRVSGPVLQLMKATGFEKYLGVNHFLAEDEAISHIFYHVLDPAICVYECPVRAFAECQNLPKRIDLVDIPRHTEIPQQRIIDIAPQELWRRLHNGDKEKPPLIVDVREPREYRRGHIPEAKLIPLPTLLKDTVKFPNDRSIVFVCRSGRRSRRAAHVLQQMGGMNVFVLRGGILAWEAADLLEAVEEIG